MANASRSSLKGGFYRDLKVAPNRYFVRGQFSPRVHFLSLKKIKTNIWCPARGGALPCDTRVL